jgi:hypothetical protein
MDAAESCAKEYLERQGLGPVQFEPDGNCPPDFLLSDGTAVEVRRLNQHFDHVGESRALEADDFPLLNGMRSLLAEWPAKGCSWWIDYHFHRPVPMWRELRPIVRRILATVDGAGEAPSERIAVAKNFSMKFINATAPLQSRFVLAGYADFDRGGWLMYELERNIRRCVEEKTRKIAPFRDRYQRWWLVLLDQIGYAGTAIEADLFTEKVLVEMTVWERVILLDPANPGRAQVIPQPNTRY